MLFQGRLSSELGRILRFALAGIVAFLAYTAGMPITVEIWCGGPVGGAAVGFLFGAAVSLQANGRFVD